MFWPDAAVNDAYDHVFAGIALIPRAAVHVPEPQTQPQFGTKVEYVCFLVKK
jgi:hypothetical protein